MADLPRKAAARTARLAALPLGYAGRSALGFGKRLGGAPAEAVMNDIQQRTAEQLFRTLGELKGGAMKFGQALSVLEAALPEEMAGPYREHLTKLQDSAPPMPTQTVRETLDQDLGLGWQDKLVWLDGGPTAAASIGQVHKGKWHDGRDVAVKVQYPGAGDALRSDIKQLGRLAQDHRPAAPRHRREGADGRGRGAGGRRARLQARGRGPVDVRRGVPRRPRHRGPRRRRLRRQGADHRVARVARLARRRSSRRHPGGAGPLRRADGAVPVLRPGPHRDAARRPAPRQLPDHAQRGRLPGPARRARLRRGGPAPGAQPARRRWAP